MTRRKRGRNAQPKKNNAQYRALQPAQASAPMTNKPAEDQTPAHDVPEGTEELPRMKHQVPVEDIPREAINDLKRKHTKIVVRVKRRSAKGTFSALAQYGNVTLPVDEVLNLEDWIAQRCGGGSYAVWLLDPADTTRQLVPPFSFWIDGRPLEPVDPNRPLAPPAPEAPVTTQSLPSHLVEYLRQLSLGGTPAGAPPIALATGSVTAETFMAEQLRKAEVDKAKAEAKAQEENERVTRLEREFNDYRRTMELQLLEARMRSENAARVAPPVEKPWLTPELLAAIAPVLVALVQGSKEGSTKSLEVQASMMNTIMSAALQQANKPTPDPFDALAKIMPLLESKKTDPNAQVALFDTMAQNQLRNVGMMAGLVEQLAAANAGPETPAWLPIVQQVMAGVVQMQQGFIKDQQPAMQQLPPPPQRTIQAQQRPSAMASLDGIPQDAPAQQPAPMAPLPGAPEILPAGMVAMLPLEFRSPEWQIIIRNLHQGQAPAELGKILASHIAHLEDFGMLPSVLSGYPDAPIETFAALLRPLPVYTMSPESRAYCDVVIVATAEALVELGRLEETETEDSDEGQEPDAQDGDDDEEDEDEDASDDDKHRGSAPASDDIAH